MITPEEEFTETAGHSDLMRDLTRHVVDSALDQARAWWQAGLAVQVSLNVSASDLLDAGLTTMISAGLDCRGLPPEALMLQINERVLTAEPGHAAAAVDALAALGLSVSLDDFGTGYSSLVRLKRLPLCEIKIDSSFVGRLPASADDEVIVRSLVDLVRALGIRSVAKGVESAAAAARLREMGCEAAQGLYVSRPLRAPQATAWLRRHTVAAAVPDDSRNDRNDRNGRRQRTAARAAGPF
jgi:EAL domain-containing protein (putative c-di-GMP-specific phosphodiesterase class I)